MIVPVFFSIGVDVDTGADFTGDLKDASLDSNCTAFSSLAEKVFNRPRSMRIANTIYDKGVKEQIKKCVWEGENDKKKERMSSMDGMECDKKGGDLPQYQSLAFQGLLR
jgi:hypothetical protein